LAATRRARKREAEGKRLQAVGLPRSIGGAGEKEGRGRGKGTRAGVT